MRESLGKSLQKGAVIGVLIVCLAIFGILSPDFLTFDNILNILWQNSYVVIATLGMAILMISGGVDLSAGYAISFATVITAAALMWWNLPIPVAMGLGIATAIVASLFNAWVSIKFKIHYMMVTLGTMASFQGISFLFTDSKSIFNLPAEFKFIGQGSIADIVPISALIMVVLVAATSFLLNRTYFGRHVYAVGGNPEAARLAGISINKVKYLVSTLTGAFFGIAAVLLVTRVGSASANMAVGTEFTCMTAAVLGGIALKGGEGKLWSVVTGVFILGILANGMQLVGLGVYPQYVAKGVILIAAMAFDSWQKTRKVKP